MTYRLNTTSLYLTYPQCSLPSEEVLAQLTDLCPEISEYMVAEEQHQDGNSHIHAYLLLKRKVNFKNPNCLDLTGPMEEKYHGNYQSGKSRLRLLRYIMKEGKYITNIKDLPATSTNKWAKVLETAETGSYKEALDAVKEADPRAFILQHSQVMNFLRMQTKPSNKSYMTLEQFKGLPEWTRGEKTLIIWGESGLGKTSLAKILLPKALFATHMDTLKRYNESFEGIILDDMSFLHLPREAQIHLVDCYDERQIHCRHTIALIPAYTPKIITTNLSPSRVLATTDPAIARRVECIELKKGKNKVKCVNWNKLY